MALTLTDAQRQQYTQQALSRGVSQGKINTFIGENKDDYQRLKDIEADGAPPGAGGGGATPGGPMAGLASAGAPATSGDPGSAQMAGAPQGGGPGGGGGPVDISGPGPGRQGLGQRIIPEMSLAVAGLRRAY